MILLMLNPLLLSDMKPSLVKNQKALLKKASNNWLAWVVLLDLTNLRILRSIDLLNFLFHTYFSEKENNDIPGK